MSNATHTPKLVERYAFVNTRSSKGNPVKVTFPSDSVMWVRKWHNIYGNPSYTIQLSDGRLLYLVDDFTGTSEFPCSYDYVKTRKALFTGTPYAD